MTLNSAEASRPLDGVRILEVGQYISGPYCSMLLADQGAEVIKIERPGVGDPRRQYDPLISAPDLQSMSGGFISYNRNKRSVTLDLQTAKGAALFRDLAQVSDVVVENLRPGAMRRVGLDYENLKRASPRLIYCAISGYGRLEGFRGMYADRPAFDTAIQAMAGVLSVIGSGDGNSALSVTGFADIYTGVFGALAISLALYARERTGRGTFIDQAMYDTVASMMERNLMLYEYVGVEPRPGVDQYAPVGVLKAQDGVVALILPTDEMWRRFCDAIDRPDLVSDDRLQSVLSRAANFASVIKPEAEAWTTLRSRTQVVAVLSAHGVPIGEGQSIAEIYRCKHLESRRMFVDIDDGVAGRRRLIRSPLLLSEYEPLRTEPPPKLGADTARVLKDLLDVPEADIAEWRAAGVV